MFLFIKRYLLAKKSHSVVNIITALSLVAVSLPVAAIIILLSVFNGFGEWVLQANKLVDPDLAVVRSHGNFFDIEAIDYRAIASLEQVEALALVSDQTMLLEKEGRQAVATLRGVDSLFLEVVPLDQTIVKGEYQVEFGELDRMVLGRSLAFQLGATNLIDCFVEVYALKGSGFSSLLPMSNYTQRRTKVVGLYSADESSEGQYAITSLRAVQRLTNTEDKASQLFVKLREGASESRAAEAIGSIVGEEFRVKRRYDFNPMFYDILYYEKWGVLFISMLIMVLASFSLIGALSILIIEKRGDISTLRALGGSWSFIRRIFFGEGVLISGLGVGLGVVVGCTITKCQEWFGWVKIPTQNFTSNNYPVELFLSDVVIVVIASLAIATSLSYIVVRQMIKNR